MTRLLIFACIALCTFNLHAQTLTADYLNIKSGNGKGIRFWNGNQFYQITMGNSSEYKYGPVQDFSIKTSMNRSSSLLNRGWVWGETGKTPIASLRTDGTMQVSGTLSASALRPLTGDWEFYRNGEHLEIREPEQSNKVWATFKDDIALHLSGTPNLWVDGQIGVGTKSPDAGLHIFSSWPDFPSIKLEYTSSTAPEGDIGSLTWEIRGGGGLAFKYNDIDRFVIYHDGSASHSGYVFAPKFAADEFSTNGDNFLVKKTGFVYARQIEVQSTGSFPDYVFESDYNLKSIEEVERFIKEEKHLPNVPTAEEVKANGHNLEEIDKVLLRKVEELMLYVIELKNENIELRRDLNEVTSQMLKK